MPTTDIVEHWRRLLAGGYLAKNNNLVIETIALLEKLPVTADGVPIVPGMRVWHCPDYKSPTVIGFGSFYCLGSGCKSEGCQSDYGCSGVHHPLGGCYSTRAAAEAALQEQQAREGEK